MEQENEWTTVIESRTKFFQLNIGEVIRYRDLIKMFVKRAFTLSYKQTILGPGLLNLYLQHLCTHWYSVILRIYQQMVRLQCFFI